MQKNSASTQQKAEPRNAARKSAWSADKAAAMRKSARRKSAGYCNCDCNCGK